MTNLVIGALVFGAMAACTFTGGGDDPTLPRDDSPVGDEPGRPRPHRSASRDFNGDGFDDLVIGAGEGSAQGTVFVKVGSADGTSGQVLQFTGDQPRARFGWSVAVAGDLNKDGFAELVIGQPSYSGAQGAAFVYFGGASFDNVAETKLDPPSPEETFGRAVASAGDMNGDGYDDLVVSAHSAARAWVYFGGAGATLDPVADVTLTGPGPWFGQDATTVGDVNGDGYDDLLIGAPDYDGSGARAYLYLGGATPDGVVDAVIGGRKEEPEFARSIAGLGDVNGDGYDDFAIGSPDGVGRVHFFLGGPSKTYAQADLELLGRPAAPAFGWSVAGAGDLNRDGLADVLVSAPTYTYLGRNVGEVRVIYGARSFDATQLVTLTSTEDHSGRTINAAGDVNGDGAADLVTSSWTNELKGKASVYFGRVGQPLDSGVDLSFLAPQQFMPINVR